MTVLPDLAPVTLYYVDDHSSQNPDTIRYSFTYSKPGSYYYFFGARVNPDNANYLDTRLEGDTTGWVTIRFTETRSMV